MPMVGMVSCCEISLRDLGRHRLEFQHEAAGILDRQRIFQDLHGGIRGAALDLEAAEHRDGVRREPDMRRGRNAGVDQRLRICACDLPPCGFTASHSASCMKRVALASARSTVL